MTPARPVSELNERELLLLLHQRFEDHLAEHDRFEASLKFWIGIVVPIISGAVAAIFPFVVKIFS